LLTQQILGNVFESLIPYLTKIFTSLIGGSKIRNKEKDEASVLEEQLGMLEYTQIYLIYDYCEMVIQFGYTILFSVAFPLAPLFSLFNNVMEIRLDGLKLFVSFLRPKSVGAKDIGIWYHILEYIALASIVTNCLIIGITSKQLDKYLTGWAPSTIVWIVVAVEHILLLLKLLSMVAIPDEAGWVTEARYKKLYERDGVLPPGHLPIANNVDSNDWNK